MKAIKYPVSLFLLVTTISCGKLNKDTFQPTSVNSNTKYNEICNKRLDIVLERTLISEELFNNAKNLNGVIDKIYIAYLTNNDQKFAKEISLNIYGKVNSFHTISLNSFKNRLYQDCSYNIQNNIPNSFKNNLVNFNSNIIELKMFITIEFNKINVPKFKNDAYYQKLKAHVNSNFINKLDELKTIDY